MVFIGMSLKSVERERKEMENKVTQIAVYRCFSFQCIERLFPVSLALF